MTVIQLRGTSASGKRTIVKSVLAKLNHVPRYGVLGLRTPEAYACRSRTIPLFVIGPYDRRTGGCDALGDLGIDGVVELLNYYAPQGDILFEGLLISSCWGAVGAWLEKHKTDAIIAPIDVTLLECRDGLTDRQTSSGQAKGNKTQEAHHVNTLKVCGRAKSRALMSAFLNPSVRPTRSWAGWTL